MNGSVDSFKHCKQLINLNLRLPKLSKDFFINIESFVPKLQLLYISSEKDFSETIPDSFTKMINLQKVSIVYDNVNEKKTYVKHWGFGKSLYEVMSRSIESNVFRINDNCVLISYDHCINGF